MSGQSLCAEGCSDAMAKTGTEQGKEGIGQRGNGRLVPWVS